MARYMDESLACRCIVRPDAEACICGRTWPTQVDDDSAEEIDDGKWKWVEMHARCT